MRQVIQKNKRIFIREMKHCAIQTIIAGVIFALLLLIFEMAGIEIPSFSEIVWAFVIAAFVKVVCDLIACIISVIIIGNKER